ncbi:putative Mce family protein [Nocardia neocaledoniensis NBRC 108232]|uniref:Virulence factor Mce-like protein n=1 Tax=Nocardia neocaledoniensis TaxID=236511 RepID=A0A317NN94_9NOCA|nr:MCE family protein [Nocardia neocaledoniensis]PWV76263.1 virulence factor Mce-like protein [Nocardia neocaledoniensis]GEM32241.1 putative Mce family protein [Nocardia neocaledoniensis NBRC 108232]
MSKLKRSFLGNRNFWLGVIGSLVIVVLLVGSTIYQFIGIGRQSIEAEFVQAAGIKTGDKVAVSGVQVGTVTGAKIEGDHVVVTLDVDNSLKFGPDAHASIKMATLLGARYVDLKPGDGSGLKDDTIPRTNTDVPYDIADVVQVGTPKFEELDTKKLAASLNTINGELGDSPQLVAQALDSVGALAKVVDRRKGEVDSLLKDLNRVTQLLADNRNSILLVITQGEAIANRVMERQNLLRQLLDNIATLTRQLEEIGAENGGQFAGTIGQLNTMAEGLQKNKDNLDKLLQIGQPTARYFNNALGNGNYGDVSLPWIFPDNWLCFVQVIQGCAG